MSQHYFDTSHEGFPITVQLGWDRPMQCFFLVIMKPAELVADTTRAKDDEILYSYLHEEAPFGHGLDHYREVLRRFQITLPESLFIEAENDAARNVGNRIAVHWANSSFTEWGL